MARRVGAVLSMTVIGCATPGYRSAEIVRGPLFGSGRVTVSDPASVRQVAACFPGVGTGNRVDAEVGGMPEYSVTLHRDDGTTDTATTLGAYDHARFAAIVGPLFPTTAATTNPGK